MGQMMALDPTEIEALAAKSNYPEYGISGRCNYISERGVRSLGLSGNKAQHADLTVELGFSSDMGVTNSRYPEEICEGQAQVNQGSMMGLSYAQLDVSTEEMENVDLYMQSLSVPARRNVNNEQVIKGEQNFYKAKCHLCHVTTLHTKPRGSILLNGTRLPWLGSQTIHPYSDFLLHDMGSEIMGVGLNDNYVSGLARGNEWRTTPLWGIGLQETVNGHTYFLHDGRARNYVEAIMWHGGEGEASKNLFKKMSKEDRDALIAFMNKKAGLEKEVALRNQKIQQAENKLKQREMVLSQRQEEIQRKKMEAEAVKENLEAQLVIVDKKKDELDKLQQQEIDKLEAISGLSAEEAKERLVESLKEEAKTQAQSFINDIMDDAKLTASKEAKRIVIQSIQRVATETAIENSVTVFHIESDEIKGRIIGREGRNIRALEAATGVEIVVDDTPEAIVLSAFDPVRREIARLALHQLVTDGRIHPARIEEVVAKVRKQVEEEIIETGKRTTIDLGIHGLHPELIRIIGKMKYRSSYGQNLLQHARETANLCAVMASELGLNPKKAKRAGLLHDIGKVPDEEPELPHALLGMKLAEKYKEKPDICNAIGAHHDETEMTSLLAPIVQVCDAISGARPGARREIVEAYIKRLNDLEQLAMAYPGVTKTYAIQAGRELRVIVGADKIDDKQTESLSGEIAKKIQDEMTYPGQVKITVIRETRAVSFAK